jgi:glycosyltransferase involved in cell wall biosynthesis
MSSDGVSPGLVSVLMLTMDRPQYVEPAIASVVAQTYSNWELIIVQDGPDPRIAPLVEAWSRREPRVRFFHRPQIGNIANALNHAIQVSRGEFLAILDDDDAWIEPRKLELQIACLRAAPAVAAVGGGAVVVDGGGRESLRYQRPIDPAICRQRALIANPIIHSTVLFRRADADAVGGYDDSLPGYQDWDLWLKIMARRDVTNLPDYLATYRVWNGGGSSTKILGNAWSAVRIAVRHRRYPRSGIALFSGIAYMAFALLPSALRRRLYQTLTRLKKRLFSPG